MAGGKGELAFELLNLNGLPATVLEPRSLELQRRVKWLLVRPGCRVHSGRMAVVACREAAR